MRAAVLVGLGGSLGSVLRYVLGGAAQRVAATTLPMGTLVVNLLGSGLLGLVAGLTLERDGNGSGLWLFVAVGFCGGFTTFSAFSYETLDLLRQGDLVRAAWNVFGQMAAGLLAVWAGLLAARLL